MTPEPITDGPDSAIALNETLPAQEIVDSTQKVFERGDDGYVKGVTYPRRADGRIEWHKMIDPQYIVFNSNPKLQETLVKAYGKPANELNYGELIAAGVEVDPKHVLVLLMGMIELADLRGYVEARPRVIHSDMQICACECTIEWIPNNEEPDGKISYGTADATMDNTGGWGYLTAMAGNRAFVRAVRLGLRIPILGFDEIAKKDTAIPEQTNSSPISGGGRLHTDTLRQAADKHVDDKGAPAQLSFEQVKAAASGKYKEKMESDPATWNRWEDIPPKDSLTLIKLIKTKKK